jgi:hypothetical protein
MKFKVGDKVRIITKSGPGSNYYYGKTAIITETDYVSMTGKLGYQIHILGNPDHDSYVWFEEELELIERASFTKSDLKDGMVVENRYGHRYMVMGEKLIGPDYYGWLSNYTDALTHNHSEPGNLHSHYDIIKVYKSNSCSMQKYFESGNLELIWERKEEPDYKEMTVAEIEKKLGYKVKIVDGE